MDKVAEIKEAIYKEANLLTGKDLEYGYDDFKKGNKNLMFLSGYSGAGKSTMARQIQRETGAHFVEMDDFKKKMDSNPNAPIVKEYFEKNPQLKKKVNGATYRLYFEDYLNHAKDYAKRHPNEKFVFEGVQLVGNSDKTVPRMVKGTGMFRSDYQARKRMVQSGFKRRGAQYEVLNAAMVPSMNKERYMVNKLVKGYNPGQVDELLKMRRNTHIGITGAAALGLAGGALLNHEARGIRKSIQDRFSPKKHDDVQEQKVAAYKDYIYSQMEK